MKSVAMFVLLAAVSMPGFARTRNSARIDFPNAIRVGTKVLPQGSYKMVWTGSKPQAQVSFFLSDDPEASVFQGKPSVTVPATITAADNTRDTQSPDHPTFTVAQKDGVTVLNTIEMPHSTLAFSEIPAH